MRRTWSGISLTLVVVLCHLVILWSFNAPVLGGLTPVPRWRVHLEVYPSSQPALFVAPPNVMQHSDSVKVRKHFTASTVPTPVPHDSPVHPLPTDVLTISDEPVGVLSELPRKIASSESSEAKVEAPSSDAAYINNPVPAYPALSHRLGEQGRVVVHVLIGHDGLVKSGKIQQSSGFNRLDQAALRTALSWRYRPGKTAGVVQDMGLNVPIIFVLN